MRDKYIEERFRRFFIFGESADGSRVDISDGERDVVQGVTREQAECLIAERDLLIDRIVAVLQRGPVAFRVSRDAIGWQDVEYP